MPKAKRKPEPEPENPLYGRGDDMWDAILHPPATPAEKPRKDLRRSPEPKR